MSFGRELHTFTETSTFKSILTLDKWSHHNVADADSDSDGCENNTCSRLQTFQ